MFCGYARAFENEDISLPSRRRLSFALLLPFCKPGNHNIPIKLFTEFLSKSLSESIVSVFQNGEHASFRYSLQNISKAHLN